MHSDLKQAIYLIADEMRGMATLGQRFAHNPYEAERAERIGDLAVRLVTLVEEDYDEEAIRAVFSNAAFLHASPAMGTDAAVFNKNGEVLLIQRRDSGQWALPGGIAEIGRTLGETVLLELWEEAGLRGTVVRLLGVFDGQRWGSSTKVHLNHAIFEVHCEDLTPTPGLETLDAQFFGADALPELYAGHDRIVPLCFSLRERAAYFDPASSVEGDMPMYQRKAGD